MTYTPLLEPCISCAHIPYRSPLLMRLEVGHESTFVTIAEYQERPPHIQVDGHFADAKWVMLNMIASLRHYVDSRWISDSSPLLHHKTHWRLDLRRADYDAILSLLDNEDYRLLAFGKFERKRFNADLQETCTRLSDLYSIFWPN